MSKRELRALARYQKSLIGECNHELNRLQKILEGANIKLISVIKDINGVSVQKLHNRIITDDLSDADETSRLIHGRILPKMPRDHGLH